jgi:hypothetical protein
MPQQGRWQKAGAAALAGAELAPLPSSLAHRGSLAGISPQAVRRNYASLAKSIARGAGWGVDGGDTEEDNADLPRLPRHAASKGLFDEAFDDFQAEMKAVLDRAVLEEIELSDRMARVACAQGATLWWDEQLAGGGKPPRVPTKAEMEATAQAATRSVSDTDVSTRSKRKGKTRAGGSWAKQTTTAPRLGPSQDHSSMSRAWLSNAKRAKPAQQGESELSKLGVGIGHGDHPALTMLPSALVKNVTQRAGGEEAGGRPVRQKLVEMADGNWEERATWLQYHSCPCIPYVRFVPYDLPRLPVPSVCPCPPSSCCVHTWML